MTNSETKTSPRYIVKLNEKNPWNGYDVVDSLTGIVQDPDNTEAHAYRLAAKMELEAKPPVVLTPKTRDDFLKLSYYTLCKLSDVEMTANPMEWLPILIARGERQGILTVDDLGNFISFV